MSKPSIQSQSSQKDLIHSFYKNFFNSHNLDALSDYVSPDIQDHSPFDPSLPPGIEGLKMGFGVTFSATPDVKVQVLELVQEGDLIVSREQMTGTFTGKLGDIEPTGHAFSVSAMNMYRIVDNRIVERWGNFDELAMLTQMGLLPPQ